MEGEILSLATMLVDLLDAFASGIGIYTAWYLVIGRVGRAVARSERTDIARFLARARRG